MPDADQGGGGLLDSARRMGSSALGLLHNRLSLAAIELQEEKLRALSLLIWLGVAFALGLAGILVAIGAVAFFLWERAGYAGLVGLALATMLGAGVVLWLLRRRITHGPQPFATTVSEFQKDLECLRPPE
jgi:uncharacterized membrane protein YqjE